jgi:glutathione synthase/RimK-type ligase-like ATP-grasp enzyme
VLVLGAGAGFGNSVIRSLRAGDARLVVLGAHHDRFVLQKSAADHNYLIRRVEESGAGSSLLAVVRQARVDLVIPTSDAQVTALSRLRRQLGSAVLLPRHHVIARCQDKYALTRFLRARGLPVPRTYPVRRLEEIATVFARLSAGGRVWCRVRRGSGSLGAVPVKTAEQARNWIRHWADMRGVPPRAFTLSEYLPGRDFACQSVWRDGRLVLTKTCERLSYFGGGSQPSGVSSIAALAKTVVAPRVVEICTAAVRALDPEISGAFSIDLKEDARGEPCITEINAGRFITMLNLFDLAGRHNMTSVYVRLACGEPVFLATPYDAVEDFYFVRDVDTIPGILHADELFGRVRDARHGLPHRPRTRRSTEEASLWQA